MNKWVKALVILIVLFFLFVPLVIATKYIAITQLYDHFVTTLSNLTGINQYLINAAVVLLMIPLYFGIRMFFSINRERRLIGIFLLAVFLIVYNLGLYQLTKDVQFSFSDGRTMKWYALTPDGVKFYDRSGVEPVYGIQLKPVTPEVIRNLKLIGKGELSKVAPEKATWFNPITGDPQIWYYQSAGGSFEFFNKPGYHPLTGDPLRPVTKQIHLEWLENKSSTLPCPNCPQITIAVRPKKSEDFITPIAFYSDSNYHEMRVDHLSDTGKKEMQDFTNMIRRITQYNIIKDGADVGNFLVHRVLRQKSGLGCGDASVSIGKSIYNSDYIHKSGSERREVFLAGMNMSLKTRENVLINEIPEDLRTRIDEMTREFLHRDINNVTSLSNIDFATYRMGSLNAYDVNRDNKIDFIILEPRVKLLKPETVEIVGEYDEISIFMIVAIKGLSIKRIYGTPGIFHTPQFYCVADLDGDGNLEIMVEEGFVEAFQFVIYRFSNENLLRLFSGTVFGC